MHLCGGDEASEATEHDTQRERDEQIVSLVIQL